MQQPPLLRPNAIEQRVDGGPLLHLDEATEVSAMSAEDAVLLFTKCSRHDYSTLMSCTHGGSSLRP
jgi:hypothetical protein